MSCQAVLAPCSGGCLCVIALYQLTPHPALQHFCCMWEVRCKTKHPMANKERNINRTEREGRRERTEEGLMRTHLHFSVNRQSPCSGSSGGWWQRTREENLHPFLYLAAHSQKPSLGADMWMLIALTETFINIPCDPPRSLWRLDLIYDGV